MQLVSSSKNRAKIRAEDCHFHENDTPLWVSIKHYTSTNQLTYVSINFTKVT